MRISPEIYQSQWKMDEQGRLRPRPSAELLEVARAATGGRVILGISGKDSLAAWLYLRENGFDIIPYMFFTIPNGLSFERVSLSYYQDFFGCHIIQLLHPNFIKFWNRGFWQSPLTAANNRRRKLSPIDYHEVEDRIAIENGLGNNYLAAIGYRASDNPGRRRLINNMGAIGGQSRHYYYTVWDWTIKQVMDKIHQYGAKLSPQYELFGCTFDEYDWYQLKILYREKPDDLRAMQEFFPLIVSKVIRLKHVS